MHHLLIVKTLNGPLLGGVNGLVVMNLLVFLHGVHVLDEMSHLVQLKVKFKRLLNCYETYGGCVNFWVKWVMFKQAVHEFMKTTMGVLVKRLVVKV